MKIGIEVEGRLCGLKTIFCNELEFVVHYSDLWAALYKHTDIKQIYISDLNNTIDLNGEKLQELAADWFVTVERTEIDHRTPINISVMLNIDNDSFNHLNRNDQIKFSNDLLVYATTVRNMTVTQPIEFSGDTLI